MKKIRHQASAKLSTALAVAMAAVLCLPANPILAQADHSPDSIGIYQDGTNGVFFIATREPVAYDLTVDSAPDQYVLSLHGKGISALMRKALKRADLMAAGVIESFAMLDADHVDVLLRAPPEGLAARTVTGADALIHCVLVGAAHQPFPRACPAEKARSAQAKPNQGLYEIFVNNEDEGAAVVLISGDGQFLFDPTDLQSWRITDAFTDNLHYLLYAGKKYIDLSDAQGVTIVEDSKASAIHITLNPSAFATTVLRVSRTASGNPTPSNYGAFLNYNVSASSAQGETSGGALLDMNAFGPEGSVSSDVMYRSHVDGPSTVRLDTFFEHDNPGAVSTFRVGDSLTGASDWALPERFAGVQWATDFSTRPDLVTFPLQSLAGTAAVPSTIELFLNQSLLLRQNVPEGPFSIQQFPVITGNGDLRMTVINALGEQQTIEQPFYADASLLRPGLQSYSYEAGFERLNYGLVSNDYGPLLASATDRVGITDTFTAGVHGEWRPGIETIGTSMSTLLSTWGVLSASLAGSHAPDGSGGLFELGFDHHAAFVDVGFRAQVTSRNFTQLGLAPGALAPSSMLSAYAALSVAKGGTLAFNVTQQNQRQQPSLGVAGMSYSQSLGVYGYIQMSIMHTRGVAGGMLMGMNYTCPIGSRSSAALDVQKQGSGTQETAQFQQNAPYGDGFGYRLLAGYGPGDRGEADMTDNTDATSYYVAVANTSGADAYQANATGSIALLDGEMHFIREIPDSFGVVRVPGFPGVRIYEDNQLVGTTDASGDAFVPNLRAYQANDIQIEQADLPLDVDVSSTTMTAIPYRHAGLVLTFPVKHLDNASYALVQANGAFVPAGSQAVYEGNTYPVGFNGLVYLPALKPSEPLTISWPTGHCVAYLSEESHEKTHDVPRLVCR